MLDLALAIGSFNKMKTKAIAEKDEAPVSSDKVDRFPAGAAIWQVLCPPAYGVNCIT